jgi:hypothetical protein
MSLFNSIFGSNKERLKKEKSKKTTEIKNRVKYYPPSDVGVIVKHPDSIEDGRVYDLKNQRVYKISKHMRQKSFENKCYLGGINNKSGKLRWVLVNPEEVESNLKNPEFVILHSQNFKKIKPTKKKVDTKKTNKKPLEFKFYNLWKVLKYQDKTFRDGIDIVIKDKKNEIVIVKVSEPQVNVIFNRDRPLEWEYFSVKKLKNIRLELDEDDTYTLKDDNNFICYYIHKSEKSRLDEIVEKLIELKDFKSISDYQNHKEKDKIFVSKNLEVRKKEIVKLNDFDGDGKIDLLINKDFIELVKTHQSKIIGVDKNFLHNLIRLSKYLDSKKNNIELYFNSINKKNIITSKELEDSIGVFQNQLHSYKLILFHSISMVISLVDDEMFTFYEIYETFDELNIWNSKWEKEVHSELLNIGKEMKDIKSELEKINSNLQEIIGSINFVEKSIQEGFNNLNYSTEVGFKKLNNSVNNHLKDINSSINFNSLLVGINSYQTYKLRKND